MTAATMHTIPRDLATLQPSRGLPGLAALPLPAALDRYLKYRRTVAELQACPDRVLSDLGIERHDIPRLAREAIAEATA